MIVCICCPIGFMLQYKIPVQFAEAQVDTLRLLKTRRETADPKLKEDKTREHFGFFLAQKTFTHVKIHKKVGYKPVITVK